MNDALGYFILFAILAGAAWRMVTVFRAGMKAKFFLSYQLLDLPFLINGVFLFGTLLDWVFGREIDWGTRIWSYAIICAVCGILYPVGFLIGLRRRSQHEGIIGQSR